MGIETACLVVNKENGRAKDFMIVGVDNGYCRIYYNAYNQEGQKLLYCLQDEGDRFGGVLCYRCSTDGEPDYSIKYGKDRFEVPQGSSDIELVVRNYLTT